MLTQNNSMLPKVWLTIDIVHHILMLSETASTIALARTCKVLYSSIIGYNKLWRKLYQQHFPRDINTDIDWLDWQPGQEQRTSEAVAESKEDIIPKLTWFRRYKQRINICLNWQGNKPTLTVYLKPFNIPKALSLQQNEKSKIAVYSGWIAIASLVSLQVDLIKLSSKNMAETYPLDLDKTSLKAMNNIKFYQYRQQENNTDEEIHIIIHLEYISEPIYALKIYSVNSRELLYSISLDDKWDGRIIGTFSLFFDSQISKRNQPFYSSFSKTKLREPQPLMLSRSNYRNTFRIHTTNNNEMIILQHFIDLRIIIYKIIRVFLTSDFSLMMDNSGTTQMATITRGNWALSNRTFWQDSKFYSIDCNRVLLYCKSYSIERTLSGFIKKWKHCIRVISLNEGVILECDYPAQEFEYFILISAYNLIAFYSNDGAPLVIISLLNGKIRHHIDINTLYGKFYYFQHIIDTKIVGCNYTTQQYCVIDAITGKVSIHSFLLSKAHYFTAAYGYMILMNEETTLITSFIPELI
ncbi:hypothetical protein BDF19DRAFT_477911 [Syncephalis fuscata]|nr:hypothetical protein BDF19DRAFT_477911 [Syncephalis fuscata]